MNRETKLALLIGFVAIVVVTVLVGEHFGKARNATPATTDLGTSTAAAPSATGLTVDPITSTPVATPSAPLSQPGASPTTGGVQPVVLTNGAPTLTSAAGTTPPSPVSPAATGNAGTGNPNVFMPAANVDTTGTVPATVTGGEVPGTRPVTTLTDIRTPAAANTPATTTPTLAGRPISTGVEKMHPVQRGETLASLAQKYYGDKSFAKQLATYNAKRISSNGTVREGVTLRMPPKDVLTGAAVLAPNAAGNSDLTTIPTVEPKTTAGKAKPSDKPATEKATAEKSKPSGARTYTIKKGDTLMSIASKELGSAKRWESLLVANPGLDENSLRAGTTIKIPAAK